MMGNIDKVKHIQQLNEEELKCNIKSSGSWHMKYKNSAYIYIGGFPYEITEGDLVIIFSQYGEIVDCRILRDVKTGKSKGCGFICYEDQRSTILAVDNLNGADIAGRIIRVDHVEQYKIPKEYYDIEDYDEEKKLYKPTGPDGKGWGCYRIITEDDKVLLELDKQKEKERQAKLNKIFLNSDIIDEKDNDFQWEQQFMDMINQEKEKISMEEENPKRKHKHKRKPKHKKNTDDKE